MRIGTLRGDAAARRAGNEPLLQEVGLVDIANRVGFLRGSQRIDSDRNLSALGLGATQIGIIVFGTLLGSALVALRAGLAGRRVGRRRLLIGA